MPGTKEKRETGFLTLQKERLDGKSRATTCPRQVFTLKLDSSGVAGPSGETSSAVRQPPPKASHSFFMMPPPSPKGTEVETFTKYQYVPATEERKLRVWQGQFSRAHNQDLLRRAVLEQAEAASRPEAQEDDEDEEEALPHSEAVHVFQEGLAVVVQDPLLCDLPTQVTLEEVNSQIALEYGQAITVRVCKMDGEVMPVVVVQSATVLDLRKAIQRYVQPKQEREGGIQHISWSYVWRTYHLTSAGEKLTEDRKKLRDYGIRNRD
ncbi:uncharacterized protein LOC135270730 [Aotus nancymaae]|uniref:uncharacterized protein LOC135270730 n=1 Tax=Aotus nancymaae TaxID=37293 RepID=UPI0030FEC4D1